MQATSSAISTQAASRRTAAARPATTSRWLSVALWTAQTLLALTFLFAGGSKFVMSATDLTADSNLSATFMRFIGVCEALGAAGLILPGLLGIRRGLTPLAAAGLVIIMISATIITAINLSPASAVLPAAVGCVAASVLYGRQHHT